jgi:predicted nuclease of predicted toxin-antitoxin system
VKRILLDQGLAPHAAVILRGAGFDAVHVAEIGMDRAEDADILQVARDDSRICITLDHDFHAHLAATENGRPSVVLLRLQGLDAAGQADLIRSVCMQCEAALSERAAISADSESVSGGYRSSRGYQRVDLVNVKTHHITARTCPGL